MIHRRSIAAIGLSAALAVTAILATSAQGAFHLMKIREISGETSTSSVDTGYIELQMYEAGQNQVSGHNITIWDADGLVLGVPQPVGTLPLSGANPPNSETQRTILIGDMAVAGRDFTLELTPFFDTAAGMNVTPAGAACFETIDCVSWGAFTGAANLPDGATPFGTTLPSALALKRNIGANRPTCLDPADDTNNSANDFASVARDPTPNATTPVETGCTPPATAPPGNPTSPINPAGNVRKRKCKKKQRTAAAAKRRKCKKKRR